MKKIRLRYDVIGAGPVGHPQEIMERVAKEHTLQIVEAVPAPIGDCWIFEVLADEKSLSDGRIPYLPSYLTIVA